MFKHDQCIQNFYVISSFIMLNVESLVKKEPSGVPFFMLFHFCWSIAQRSIS